ncbi:antitoxin Xre/MbcA/ParS toxin-binding domain-containing protein [Salinarimonas soli]|uniref:DUF2384 domain-containing protein n=1 Tax=Salinarimonas soli TaxID=1638099 RepID=A0A5B2VBB5_9HYPH|nr:antitoxin Xre/MbcA/ParS toxin-binding domain-containing protein [Salinarimonas soli]KAA2235740.1 DUF2384 domain-containing protein [Salinarimonas soli]
MLSEFLAEVTDSRRRMISPQRIADRLRVTQAEVARLAKVHRNTLAQKPDSAVVQEGLGEIARIVSTAADLLGGDTGRAVVWFRHQPLSGFDGRTAAELVEAGNGAAVLAHLAMLRDGVYG